MIPDGALDRRRNSENISKIDKLYIGDKVYRGWAYRGTHVRDVPVKQLSEALRDIELELARYP